MNIVFHKRQKGPKGAQSLSEYVILIALVSAVLLAMQIYAKRGLQKVIKYASDEIGTQETANLDPYKEVVQDESSYFDSSLGGSQRTRVYEGAMKKSIRSTSASSGNSTYSTQEDE